MFGHFTTLCMKELNAVKSFYGGCILFLMWHHSLFLMWHDNIFNPFLVKRNWNYFLLVNNLYWLCHGNINLIHHLLWKFFNWSKPSTASFPFIVRFFSVVRRDQFSQISLNTSDNPVYKATASERTYIKRFGTGTENL